MAQISRGILGGISGTVGTVVGGRWKGIDYIRAKSLPRPAGSGTPAQKAQRLKFAVAIRFISSLGSLTRYTFRQYAVKQSGANSALSYIMKNAIIGTDPSFSLNYGMVLISRGDLPNAGTPAATAAANHKINFSWTNNSGTGKALTTDQPILVVHCPELNQTAYVIDAVANRATGAAVVNVPSFSGQTVETWIGFISADGREVATSVYTGQLMVL